MGRGGEAGEGGLAAGMGSVQLTALGWKYETLQGNRKICFIPELALVQNFTLIILITLTI